MYDSGHQLTDVLGPICSGPVVLLGGLGAL